MPTRIRAAGAAVRRMTEPAPAKAGDNAGNMLTDNRAGSTTTYTYNKRNRLASATSGALVWGYTYNGLEQLAVRTLTTGGTDVTHFVHDVWGNVIAETGGGGPTGATGTLREYIWLPETEIAPTAGSRTTVDRPLAVIEDVETATPLTWWVSVDHLNRPIKMTNAAKASVWDAVWLPWGGVHSITGTGAFNLRFPGQWFQLEAGLHYNWHRHYDPTLGRYTQPDPLGFVDGPSVYGYAGGSPGQAVDPDGEIVAKLLKKGLELCRKNPACGGKLAELEKKAWDMAKECRCKVEKHGPHHYFPGLGYCEHYQLICWAPGIGKSGFSTYWPLPGRCFPTSQGGPPAVSTPANSSPVVPPNAP